MNFSRTSGTEDSLIVGKEMGCRLMSFQLLVWRSAGRGAEWRGSWTMIGSGGGAVPASTGWSLYVARQQVVQFSLSFYLSVSDFNLNDKTSTTTTKTVMETSSVGCQL